MKHLQNRLFILNLTSVTSKRKRLF